jgi:hypothetical protein
MQEVTFNVYRGFIFFALGGLLFGYSIGVNSNFLAKGQLASLVRCIWTRRRVIVSTPTLTLSTRPPRGDPTTVMATVFSSRSPTFLTSTSGFGRTAHQR